MFNNLSLPPVIPLSSACAKEECSTAPQSSVMVSDAPYRLFSLKRMFLTLLDPRKHRQQQIYSVVELSGPGWMCQPIYSW